LTRAPAARLAEAHIVAPVVMVDSWAGLALMATIEDCFPSLQPTEQKLCVRED
jgi:hypothetical protein